jgi:hypothetical protein
MRAKMIVIWLSLFGITFLLMFNFLVFSPKAEDKSSQIAEFIQGKVNAGGYTGCSCRSIGNQLVQCDMNFPAGTSKTTVIANTEGTADLFAQVGALASTIYYTGYSGSQKVCEFQYDMYSRRVTRKF